MKKKLLLLIVAFMFVFGTCNVAKATCFVVIKDGANIRSGPGTSYKVVKKAKLYGYYYSVKIEGDWMSFFAGSVGIDRSKQLHGWKKVEHEWQKYKPGVETYLYSSSTGRGYIKGEIISYTGKIKGVYHEVIYYPEGAETWYIHKSLVKICENCVHYSLSMRNAIAKKFAADRAAKWAAKRIIKIKSFNWPSEIEQTVINRKIRLGMTKQQVIESWGKPKDINRTVSRYSVHEQWVYSNAYLYFENGVLTTWQD